MAVSSGVISVALFSIVWNTILSRCYIQMGLYLLKFFDDLVVTSSSGIVFFYVFWGYLISMEMHTKY